MPCRAGCSRPQSLCAARRTDLVLHNLGQGGKKEDKNGRGGQKVVQASSRHLGLGVEMPISRNRTMMGVVLVIEDVQEPVNGKVQGHGVQIHGAALPTRRVGIVG